MRLCIFKIIEKEKNMRSPVTHKSFAMGSGTVVCKINWSHKLEHQLKPIHVMSAGFLPLAWMKRQLLVLRISYAPLILKAEQKQHLNNHFISSCIWINL